jgi:ADP-ribose pyrophosphatase YjhB (NUDIX family)
MPYIGSYIWKIRQKIGHDLLIMPSVDVLAIREDGKIMMIFNKDANDWRFPGGFVEADQTSEESAARELLEESGLETETRDLIPFAYQSGYDFSYENGDHLQFFSQTYLTKKFRDTGEKLDEAEIAARKWFSLDEIRKMKLDSRIRQIFDAYEEFSRTGKYQIINPKEKK